MKKLNVVVIIPSLNPDYKLVKYVEELKKIGFEKIIVVNDGSSKKYSKYFLELKKRNLCIVLNHMVNQGKGRALKTAFNYYLDNFNDCVGVVTADSDGQHLVNDTYNVAMELLKNKNYLILGTRNFNQKNIPFRSKLGNKITTFIFKLLFGKTINDTQTGLRGLSNKCVKASLGLVGERYEYEINMLIKMVHENIKIKEVCIETVYLNNNESSYFNPLKDSLKIYKVLFFEFFKFTFSGICSFFVDILFFALFVNFIFNGLSDNYLIIFSTIFARIISLLFNYFFNNNIVFNYKNNVKNSFVKYYILCFIQLIFSALLVVLLYNIISLNKFILKIIVDTILFFISLRIQKKYIFKRCVDE